MYICICKDMFLKIIKIPACIMYNAIPFLNFTGQTGSLIHWLRKAFSYIIIQKKNPISYSKSIC